MRRWQFNADASARGQRLDVFLAAAQAELSRSYLQKLIADGQVTVNGQSVRANHKLRIDDRVEVAAPDPVPADTAPEAIPLTVLYEDEWMLVIDKPAGMVVHPAPGHSGGTLVNALLHHCADLQGIGGVERPGIVHRLDKDTSGLVVVAKTETALRALAAQFKDRAARKEYLALAHGRFRHATGTVDAAVGRHKQHRQKMAAGVAGGRDAVTAYQVLRQFAHCALVRLLPKTGRTHQIRVHLASLGHPVVGDKLYGGGKALPDGAKMERQALHAHKLTIAHPQTSAELSFESPLPADMTAFIAAIAPGKPSAS